MQVNPLRQELKLIDRLSDWKIDVLNSNPSVHSPCNAPFIEYKY